jgi:phosphatidylserine decarboxylase
VVAIERVLEQEFYHEERLKISIYMSALNVHVNRIPVTGKVIYTRYHPGKYLVAFHPKASELNERQTVVIEAANGQKVLIRQIAGILARRIVCYLKVGQAVRAGDELGFIKFGSRCDVFVPLDANIQVALQQRVKGGETILTIP